MLSLIMSISLLHPAVLSVLLTCIHLVVDQHLYCTSGICINEVLQVDVLVNNILKKAIRTFYHIVISQMQLMSMIKDLKN